MENQISPDMMGDILFFFAVGLIFVAPIFVIYKMFHKTTTATIKDPLYENLSKEDKKIYWLLYDFLVANEILALYYFANKSGKFPNYIETVCRLREEMNIVQKRLWEETGYEVFEPKHEKYAHVFLAVAIGQLLSREGYDYKGVHFSGWIYTIWAKNRRNKVLDTSFKDTYGFLQEIKDVIQAFVPQDDRASLL
jgi:hypothetical protein